MSDQTVVVLDTAVWRTVPAMHALGTQGQLIVLQIKKNQEEEE